MTDRELRSIFEAYLDAFATPSPAEQERLLRASVADDVVYTNPGVEGRGVDAVFTYHSNRAEADAVAGLVAERFDYLVNNAGTSHGKSFEQTTEAELDAPRTRRV